MTKQKHWWHPRAGVRAPVLAAAMWMSFSPGAWAYCEGGRYPNLTVREELRATPLVIIGRVVERRIVVDPVRDPAGYEAEIHRVRIEQVVHGTLPPQAKVGQVVSFYGENTSSRFPMAEGTRYLLFVSRAFDQLWINSCGNSVDAERAGPVLRQIRGAR